MIKEVNNNTHYYIFVKGEDDFGRTPIKDGTISTFEVYARPNVGDIMHFMYPQKESAPLYIVTEIRHRWSKEGFHYTEGLMQLFPQSGKNGSWQSWIDANRPKNHDFVERHTIEANRRYLTARKRITK